MKLQRLMHRPQITARNFQQAPLGLAPRNTQAEAGLASGPYVFQSTGPHGLASVSQIPWVRPCFSCRPRLMASKYIAYYVDLFDL
jgi:hypothetical protein